MTRFCKCLWVLIGLAWLPALGAWAQPGPQGPGVQASGAQTQPLQPAPGTPAPRPTVQATLARLSATMDKVDIKDATTKEAFKWWSDTVGVKLMIDWDAMASEGVTPDAKVEIDLAQVPAGVVLGLIMQRASPQADLVYYVTPWYIQVLTKKQANKTNVLRVYEVGDLVHDPTVGQAPAMGILVWAPIGRPGTTLYAPAVARVVDINAYFAGPKSNQQMGDELAQVVREQIEPDVWQEAGGRASIRFFRGTLVVNAPEYVHAQIGAKPRDSQRPVVFLNKTVKIEGPGPVRAPDAGVTTYKEVETTSVNVNVGVTIQK